MTQAQAEASAAPGAAPETTASPGPAPALSMELLADLAPDLRPEQETVADTGDAADAGAPTATPAPKAPDAAKAPDGTPEADAGDQPLTPEAEVATWADLALDNPQTVTRIPRGRLAEVFAEYNQRMEVVRDVFYEQGLKDGEARAAAASQQQTLAQRAAEIEALVDPESDSYAPDMYQERVANFPGGKRGFARVLAEMTPVPAGSSEDFATRAQVILRELAPLANRDELVSELRANWNYPATEAGLQKLSLDVGRLLERGAKTAPPSPAEVELGKRQAGLNGLKATPKPDVTEGRTTPVSGDPTTEQVKTMSPEQLEELERKDPGILVRLARAAGAKS